MVDQTKLQSFCMAPKYSGFQVPHDYHHTMELDVQNDNTMWQDATALDMAQPEEYNTCKEMGMTEPLVQFFYSFSV
jgi:hypothetical protein